MVQVSFDSEWEVLHGLRPAYLHLMLAHYKSQGQGHVHFCYENLGNGDKYGKKYVRHQMQISSAPVCRAYRESR